MEELASVVTCIQMKYRSTRVRGCFYRRHMGWKDTSKVVDDTPSLQL